MASVLNKFIIAYTDGIITVGHLEGHRDMPRKKEVHIPVMAEAELDAIAQDLKVEEEPASSPEPELTMEEAREELRKAGFSEDKINSMDWSGFKK
jgi:hypothetical protein